MTREAALTAVAARRRATDRARSNAKQASSQLRLAIIEAAAEGSSQREIAARAGVSQPYVAKMLQDNLRFQPKSRLGTILASKRHDVLDLLRSRGVENVAVFGSVAAGTDGPTSDIDLMVDIPKNVGLFALAHIETELSDLLGVPVDLAPRRLLNPAVRDSAERVVAPL